MNSKIREAQLEKIPSMLVIGDKEASNSKVAVRLRSGQDLGAMELNRFIEMVQLAVNKRAQNIETV